MADTNPVGKPKKRDIDDVTRLRRAHRALWLVALLFFAIIVGGTFVLQNRPEWFLGDAMATHTALAAPLQATEKALAGLATVNHDIIIMTQDALKTYAAYLRRIPASTQTAQARRAQGIVFEDDFALGLQEDAWEFSWTWHTSETGLQAIDDRAWLLTQADDFSEYALEIMLTPSEQAGDIGVLLNVRRAADHGAAIRLLSDGQRLTEVGVYRASYTYLQSDDAIFSASNLLTSQALDRPLGKMTIHVEARGRHVTVIIDDVPVMDVIQLLEIPESGALGVIVPEGTTVERIRISR